MITGTIRTNVKCSHHGQIGALFVASVPETKLVTKPTIHPLLMIAKQLIDAGYPPDQMIQQHTWNGSTYTPSLTVKLEIASIWYTAEHPSRGFEFRKWKDRPVGG